MCGSSSRNMRPFQIPATITTVVCTLAVTTAAHAQTRRTTDHAVLKVPFVTQHDDVCAAAAPVMVLKYWGRTDARPEDFVSHLTCTARGLDPDALTSALQARGWRTEVSRNHDGALDQLANEVRRGHPVIALVGDRSDTNHYVVVIAATPETVVVQDPAVGPYQ